MIPDLQIFTGQQFPELNLDDYVTDPDHPDDQLSWIITGDNPPWPTISPDRVLTFEVPAGWNGPPLDDRVHGVEPIPLVRGRLDAPCREHNGRQDADARRVNDRVDILEPLVRRLQQAERVHLLRRRCKRRPAVSESRQVSKNRVV